MSEVLEILMCSHKKNHINIYVFGSSYNSITCRTASMEFNAKNKTVKYNPFCFALLLCIKNLCTISILTMSD